MATCREKVRMKILFIDYKVLFTDGLESLLEASGMEVDASYAKDIKSGIGKILDGIKPELIFVDVNLYEGSNDHLVEELHVLSRFAPIIIISEIETKAFEKLTIEAGASGFICKTNNKNILFEAVEAVSHGSIYSECHSFGDSYKPTSSNVTVTSRQYEILKLLSKGLLNKQIASELNISINTVNTHLHDIFRRLHVKNRTAAVQSAYKIGLI